MGRAGAGTLTSGVGRGSVHRRVDLPTAGARVGAGGQTRSGGHEAGLPAGWDALAGPDDLFLTRRWLRVVEEGLTAPLRYLWLDRAGQVVAAVPAVLATVDVPWVLSRPDVILHNSLAAGLPDAAGFLAGLPGAAGPPDPADSGWSATGALMPGLVAGGRHLGHTRMLSGPATTAADLDRLLAALEQLATGWRAASVAFPYLDDRDDTLGGVLRGRGYRSFVSGRYSTLTVPADGFPGYLAALPRKRRVSVAAERRRIRSAGVVLTTRPLADVDLAVLARLEVALLRKHGIDWDPDRGAAILAAVAESFGQHAFVVQAYADGGLRGFVLVLAHADQWYCRQAGFDYPYQRRTRLPLYFELLFYHLVAEAAGAGVTTIHYGLGSTEAKRSRGCHVTDQRCWLRTLPGVPG
ncbi:GNAT family N-acetyltransferase [Plantactinospora sonchi]|uniref:GNAT family N-acetyltransferase n=1 Tax=Plantactinospora sonchi TaxID=1544735 RepID=A0ABU7S3L3_9ACTN